MKIKNILLIALFLICNIRAQDNSIEAKLKSAIDNYNFKSVEDIINNDPSLLASRINDKSLLDYALNVAQSKDINNSNDLDDDTYLSLNLNLSDEVLELTEDKRKQRNILNIINFFEGQNVPTIDPLELQHKKIDIDFLPINSIDKKLIDLVDLLIFGPIIKAIELIKNKDFYPVIEYLYNNESQLLYLVKFLFLVDEIKTNTDDSDTDILKSILIGQVCKGCNKYEVEQSLEWVAYNIAKENNFKSLIKFIRDLARAELVFYYNKSAEVLPSEIKREITKFL